MLRYTHTSSSCELTHPQSNSWSPTQNENTRRGISLTHTHTHTQHPHGKTKTASTCRWTLVKLFLLENSKLVLISRYSRAQASRRVDASLELQHRRICKHGQRNKVSYLSPVAGGNSDAGMHSCRATPIHRKQTVL